jgi:hypothetical protein
MEPNPYIEAAYITEVWPYPNFMAYLEAETWCGDLEKNPDALKVPSDPTAQALKRSCSS